MWRTYRDLFRDAPGLLRLSAIALVGRLPGGMAGIALVLLIEGQSGSYGLAGVGVALFAAGAAAGGLLYGALIGRFGVRRVLLPGGCLAGAALAIVPLAVFGAPPVVYLAVAGLAGVALPPLAATIRSQWNRAYGDAARLTTASTLESVLGEAAFFVGPLLVSLALLTGSEAAPLALAGALAGGGAVAFGLYAREVDAAGDGAAGGDRSWRRRPGFLAVLAAGFLWCVSFGIVAVAVVASAQDAGHRAVGGVLLAMLSLGAIVGGLWFGARRWRASPARLGLVVLALYAVALAPLAAAAERLVALGALLALAGTTSAAVLACLNLRVVEAVPARMEVEAYGWLVAATVAGLVVGPGIGGWLVEAVGPAASFVAASAIAGGGVAALVVDVIGHRRAPRPAPER